MHPHQKYLIVYLFISGAIILGYCIGRFQLWPSAAIDNIIEFIEGHPESADSTTIQKLSNDLDIEPHLKLVEYSAETNHPERDYKKVFLANSKSRRVSPLIFLHPDRTPSLRLIFGSFDHNDSINGALLLSDDGDVIWEWIVHERLIQSKRLQSEMRKFPHGILVMNDGSLVFSFDGGVSLQRFDRCSNQIWASNSRVDHSLYFGPQGQIWGVMSPDRVRVFNPLNGNLINDLPMKKWVHRNPSVDPLGVRQFDYDDKSTWINNGGGYWHPNDAEPLPEHLADAFPQFEVGDLLMSYRSLNLIFVVSPRSSEIKWWRMGAWRRQHDPDWQSDGSITVFNNNMHLGTSTIVKIDPKTYEHKILYDGTEELFYSSIRGKHEVLDNGHISITSPQQGRAFEVNKQGEVVFEFANQYDDNRALLISEMITLPLNYFGDNLDEPCGVAMVPSTELYR